MEGTSNQLIWRKQRTLYTSNSINESHYFLSNNNNNHTSSSNCFDLNHQNREIVPDVVLKYINHALLDEQIDENIYSDKEEAALKAMEKSFYGVLNQEYPSNNPPFSNFLGSPHDVKIESSPILPNKRRMEEGMKFHASINSNNNYWFDLGNKIEDNARYTGKKHANGGDLSNLGGPKCKISTLYFKEPAMDNIYDEVLLLHGYTKAVVRLRKSMQNIIKQSKETHVISVDLRTLLLHCSQAIAMDDPHNANELIKQIKKHSSPDGDGVQRMAHIFANGLEARLAGTGNELSLYGQLDSTRENFRNTVKAYNLFIISNPFVRASYIFANHTILNAIGKASKVHIIHLGIDFRSFQWPHLMLGLSEKEVKIMKLRITGIDSRQPRFRPIEIVEEQGRKLKEYARNFGIPFEYRHIAAKLEEICIEDLNIEKDELVVVNSMYRFENLGDETDVMNSPRDKVLNVIRRIKPHIFIQGIINGSFSGLLFDTRFKRILLHYSAMFDLLDSTIPRDNIVRHFLESKLWANDAFNLIACEAGSKVVEIPETYKQWELRNLRAGFEQLPIDHAIVKKIKKKVTKKFDEKFFIEEDKKWLLSGWKGRTMYALSTWQVKEI